MFLEEISCRRYDKKECKEQKEHHSYRIGTWNVRTLNKEGKLENLKAEMQRNEVSVLGVSEVRWKGQGEIRSGEYTVYYSGGERAERGRWDLEKLYAPRQRAQDILEEKLGAFESESGNAEVKCKNIKECVLDTISDLALKVEKKQENRGLSRKRSVKWMSEGNGRMSTLKKAGGTTGA